MASPEAVNGILEASDQTFPAADVTNEMNPGLNTKVEVDHVSSAVAASLEAKEEQAEADRQQKEREKDAMQSLKSAILISAAVVAVAGAIFAISKKLREK